MKALKNKKFWLNALKYIIAWAIPKLKDWVENELAIVEQKLANKILEK